MCEWILTLPNNTKVTLTESVVCGYNSDGKHYCPAKRSSQEYGKENEAARELWRKPPKCHHRSTVQYCRQIEDDIVVSTHFRDELRTEFITTEINYALIADNKRCVGNTIVKTRDYWRIIDFANSDSLSYLYFIAAIITVTLLY